MGAGDHWRGTDSEKCRLTSPKSAPVPRATKLRAPAGEPKFPTWAPSGVIGQWRHEAAAARDRWREDDDLMARRPPSSPRPRKFEHAAKRHGVPMLLERLLTDP